MPKTAGELAAYVGGELVGDARANIRGVASAENAKPGDLIYIESDKLLPAALASPASAVLVGKGVFARDKTLIRVANPKLAFARAAALLLPEPPLVTDRHPTALIHPTARLEESVALGPYVVIEENARIGRHTRIGAGCVVGANCEIGEDCVLFPRVTLYRNVHLGHRVRVHSGAVIGSDGFGYVRTEAGYEKFPQRGTVVIEDDVEIGAGCTIDRGALDETRIGRGSKLDNLVHVGHNVRIGPDCVIAAQTGISGSVSIGARVMIGGQVGFGDHCRVEDDVVLGGQAGILPGKIIRRGQTVWGTPARPLDEFKKTYPYWARLPELVARLDALEQKRASK
ncbi:MAG: UDP-3-O-(3-hydroxymyristoyl)glucosamine N-acyltransferase [Acidobacteria bacterium]|nr:UDP-3-O-(3-hydroxymyristoyl)glucosamine N-acyltransferase [Acidobacteriota bacterium]